MKNNDWKERLNVVYSTNPDFKYESVEEEAVETLDKKQQKLRVNIEKKGRGGKTVTLINGFIGTENDLKELGKIIEKQMWSRRFSKRRGDPYPRRVQATGHRVIES